MNSGRCASPALKRIFCSAVFRSLVPVRLERNPMKSRGGSPAAVTDALLRRPLYQFSVPLLPKPLLQPLGRLPLPWRASRSQRAAAFLDRLPQDQPATFVLSECPQLHQVAGGALVTRLGDLPAVATPARVFPCTRSSPAWRGGVGGPGAVVRLPPSQPGVLSRPRLPRPPSRASLVIARPGVSLSGAEVHARAFGLASGTDDLEGAALFAVANPRWVSLPSR